jgi:hypothetical protein
MMRLSKCDSCDNKGICKYTEKMKTYEEVVRNNLIVEHTHSLGDFPLSIEVKCSRYKGNCLSKDTGMIRGGSANTECGLEYIRHELRNKI